MTDRPPETVSLLLCSACGKAAADGEVPTDVLVELAKLEPITVRLVGGGGGYLLCPRCGAKIAFRSEGGALDIGIVE